MDADDDERLAVFRLEALQFRKDVHAVHTSVRPEVEQYNLTAQRRQRQRRRDVEPLGGSLQFRCTDARRRGNHQLLPVNPWNEKNAANVRQSTTLAVAEINATRNATRYMSGPNR